ncbi:AAA family ATPase [Polaromonas sp.]|uniref:AAA family ATPase n=1 Tax=Polaromonas sp. TaxID=1869339 RepID=UPI00352BCDF9
MAKKQKNIPQGRQGTPVATAPSGVLTRLMATQQGASTALGDQAVAWNEAEVLALRDLLTPEHRARFDSVIETQLCALGTAMHKAREAASAREAQAATKLQDLDQRDRDQSAALDAERAMLAEEQESLVASRAEIDRLQASLKPREHQVDEKERALAKLQLQLAEQEDLIRKGLVQEEIAMLRSTKEQLAALRDERDRLHLSNEGERAQLMEAARRESALIVDQGLSLKAHWEGLISAVGAREAELEKKESLMTEREKRLQARRQSLTSEVQERVDEMVSASHADKDRLQGQIDQADAEIQRLESELRDVRDAQRRAGGDPTRLANEVRSLQTQLDQRDEELQQLRASLERGDPSALKKRVDELEGRLAQRQNLLTVLEAEKHRWELSVGERQTWERTRLVMESSRRLLDEQVQQLQSQVNDLTNRQQAASIFPELDRMDREFTVPVHTEPVRDLKKFTIDLRNAMSHAGERGVLRFRERDIQLFVGGLAMSQLHILQGISGTGKTSLATAFAKAIGAELTVIAVQAGWRERADLLGYFNAFDRKFYELKTLQAVYRAQTQQDENRLHVVLLDEMNLSRPEQYFADFLSALEGEGVARNIRLVDNRIENAPRALIDGRDLALPQNVWFIGTANQDETTNAFADKTHDRSFVMEVHRPGSDVADAAQPSKSRTVSVSSLLEAFDEAARAAEERTHGQLVKLNGSSLSQTLANEFSAGWGSRLERQWQRFVPVVAAAGGNEEMAIDHLLLTRVIRDGKVTGRHNVTARQLHHLEDDLNELWLELGLAGEPRNCLDALQRDKRRLESGG